MKIAIFLAAAALVAQTPPFPMSDASAIAEGKEIFRMSCSVGYCHGAEGKAGRGPRIQGRTFERSYLYKVTREGIPRSSMPAWKDQLTDKQIWSVVAYMLSISQPAPESVPVAPSPAPDATSGATVKAASGPVYGEQAKGRAIFFDTANDRNCSGCHRSDGKGAGPELSGIKGRPAHEILRDIVDPAARFNARYKVVAVKLKDGQQFEGIRGEESSGSVKFFDITALPPVERTIPKAGIVAEEPLDKPAMPSYGSSYTFQQLAHLVAYLKAQDISISELLP